MGSIGSCATHDGDKKRSGSYIRVRARQLPMEQPGQKQLTIGNNLIQRNVGTKYELSHAPAFQQQAPHKLYAPKRKRCLV